MKNTNCPYTKISNFSLVSRAEAQSPNNFNSEAVQVATSDITQSLNSQLTVPFYLLVGSFFLFTFLMAAVYIYHWINFNLNDPIIKHFVPVFFIGLVILMIPLIFNLIN